MATSAEQTLPQALRVQQWGRSEGRSGQAAVHGQPLPPHWEERTARPWPLQEICAAVTEGQFVPFSARSKVLLRTAVGCEHTMHLSTEGGTVFNRVKLTPII